MDKQKRQETARHIARLIAADKAQIIATIREEVHDYIASRDAKDCLSLVARNADGKVAKYLPMAMERRYATALIAFIRQKPFDGYVLDSELTWPTGQVVANTFANSIAGLSEEISGQIIPLIISDERFIAGLSEAIIAASGATIPKLVQGKLVALVQHKIGAALSHTIDATTAETVKASVAKASAMAVSSPLAAKLTMTVIASLATTLKPVLLKLLASTAFKAAILAKVKTVIVGAVIGAFVKIVGVKLGITAGAMYAIILLPLLAAWLAYEYNNLPRKLAQSIAESIGQDLDSGFERTSHDLSEAIIKGVITTGVGVVAAQLVNEQSIQDLITESLHELQAS